MGFLYFWHHVKWWSCVIFVFTVYWICYVKIHDYDVHTTRYKLGMRMAFIQMRQMMLFVTAITIHNGWSSWPATSIVYCHRWHLRLPLSDVSWQSVWSANYRMCQLALPIQIAMSTIIIIISIHHFTNAKWIAINNTFK